MKPYIVKKGSVYHLIKDEPPPISVAWMWGYFIVVWIVISAIAYGLFFT